MNKNESKYFNTAILFDEALIYLLEKKDIEYITVKETWKEVIHLKAAIYNAKESVEIKELETPHAGDNDIVIKNIYSSI